MFIFSRCTNDIITTFWYSLWFWTWKNPLRVSFPGSSLLWVNVSYKNLKIGPVSFGGNKNNHLCFRSFLVTLYLINSFLFTVPIPTGNSTKVDFKCHLRKFKELLPTSSLTNFWEVIQYVIYWFTLEKNRQS